jgi:hypothetical protein
MKLARLKKDIDDAANILQTTTDSSAKQYIMEQQSNIQQMVDRLRTLQCDEDEPKISPVPLDATDSTSKDTPHLPAQPNSVSDLQAYSCSSVEALEPSPIEAIRSRKAKEPSHLEPLRSIEAQLQQQAMYRSAAWRFPRNHTNAYVRV